MNLYILEEGAPAPTEKPAAPAGENGATLPPSPNEKSLSDAGGKTADGTAQKTVATTGTATGTMNRTPGVCGPQDSLSMLLMLGAMFAIFYFLMIRPQKKKEKEHQSMLGKLQKNDKVVTIGGIHGVVDRVKKDEGQIVIKVDDNTKLTMSMRSVQAVVPRKSDNENK